MNTNLSTSPARTGVPWTHWLALGAVLVAALVLRLYKIDTESIWYDETITYEFLDSPTIVEFFRGEAVHDPMTVPIYYGSAYLWYRLGFTSIVGMRLLSVTAGMASIVVLYLLGRRLFGHTGGLVAALCMTFAKIHIYMSQEIRNYAFTTLFALVAVYALHEAAIHGRKWWWTLNIAANVFAGLTHFFALILPFAQGVFLVLVPFRFPLPAWAERIGSRANPPLSHAVSRAAFISVWTLIHLPFYALIPFWTRFVQSGSVEHETHWIPWVPLTRAFVAYYYVFAGSLQDGMDVIRHRPWGLPVEHALGTAFLVAGAGYVMYSVWRYRQGVRGTTGYDLPSASLLLSWLFVPPATLFILGRLLRPCFIERYVLYSSLPLYLIMGGAVATLPRQFRYIAAAMLIVVYAGNLVDFPRPLRHDIASTGAILRENFAPGEKIYACFDYIQVPMRYYAGIPYDSIVGAPDDFAEQAVAAARGGKRAWVWYIQVPNVIEPAAVDAVVDAGGLRVKKWAFTKGRWPTYLYLIEPFTQPSEY